MYSNTLPSETIFGLFNKVRAIPQIPIYIGEHSKEIYKILYTRLAKAGLVPKEDLNLIENFKTYNAPRKFKIKDISILPIEIDHSAFNAHALLIECDNKKLLHTGDIRLHGPRGKSVIPTLEKYVKKVDCLLCEGTTLGRIQDHTMTEFELQHKAGKIFQESKYTFVLCSSTNIDRIAVLHKATLKANKLFICDDYQKDILMYIDSISRSSLYKFKGKVLSYADNILELMRDKGFVMLVRYNYISKIVIKEFPNAVFVYSQYEGYLDKRFKEYEGLQKFVPQNYTYLHTSGHANIEGIKKIIDTVAPDIVIPLHTERKYIFKEITDKAIILEDMEYYEL